ncbi:helix-turn-helix transcriptional regulator [Sphingobacterium sp. PCS056]|jgi:DNA-binding HxlR family transcriptional regulator|uniref:winged helix-turn-helix transcriptional regulator n=1 Tax=Sphingobacterium sp. PCS056 TaxID=2931400 RepID=UPI00200C7B12|nr:helix-turn-helix domain-containing protein [Sphingobacterium sp. PCS056]UPZ35352.1 helix-turn-helix transcriptional regulator [Sphingobacterium sp. PCS056]UZJ64445.1 helix-turn-helix transcriptional regulator [Sphingobacterium sp. KU25419]
MGKKIKSIAPCDESCPVRASLSLLAGKWTLMILFQINENTVRYGELKRAVTGISEKMLIQELNMLVEHKLVTKKVYPQIPPKVEYSLTELGLKTLPIVDQLAQFGLQNLV